MNLPFRKLEHTKLISGRSYLYYHEENYMVLVALYYPMINEFLFAIRGTHEPVSVDTFKEGLFLLLPEKV